MREIIGSNNLIILRPTQEEDLDFVVKAENDADNAQYVGQWTKEQQEKL